MKTFNIMLNSINDVKNFVNTVNKYDFDVDLTNIKKHNSENLVNEVKNAIEQLPYKFSSLLTLKYVLGYSGKEIAEITGLSETNVRQQLMCGRKKLSEILEEDL